MTISLALKDRVYRIWLLSQPAVSPLFLPFNTLGKRGYHRGELTKVRLSVYSVYRRKNGDLLAGVLRSLPDAASHLHALDSTHPALAAWTRSVGPGTRIPLIAQLLAAHPPRPGDHVLMTDDDYEFLGTGGARFAGYAATAGLDIAMPAHHRRSRNSFPLTNAVALSTARETKFVESGPAVLMSPRAQRLVLPFPTDAQMGWGLDVWWSRLRQQGLRLGIVDATPIVHHGPVGAEYPQEAEQDYLSVELANSQTTSMFDIAVNVGRTWRPWQRRPRWVTPDGAAA